MPDFSKDILTKNFSNYLQKCHSIDIFNGVGLQQSFHFIKPKSLFDFLNEFQCVMIQRESSGFRFNFLDYESTGSSSARGSSTKHQKPTRSMVRRIV
jgi:hypothetical protein